LLPVLAPVPLRQTVPAARILTDLCKKHTEGTALGQPNVEINRNRIWIESSSFASNRPWTIPSASGVPFSSRGPRQTHRRRGEARTCGVAGEAARE
jgi:hypothetical protein